MAKNEEHPMEPAGKGSIRTIMVLLVVAVASVIVVCGVLPYMTHQWASQYEQEKDLGNAIPAEVPVLEKPTLHSDGSLEVCIRNAGPVPIQIDAVYKNGTVVAAGLDQEILGNETMCFILPGTYAPDDDVTLITKEGTQLKFKVRG